MYNDVPSEVDGCGFIYGSWNGIPRLIFVDHHA
jgi:hypothetical protein